MSEVLYVTVVSKDQAITKIVGVFDSKALATTARAYEQARTGSLVGDVKILTMEKNASYVPMDMLTIHEMLIAN